MPALIAQIILAAMNLIPTVKDVVDKIMEAILRDKIVDITNKYTDKDKKVSAIMLSIQQAKSHEQKAILFTALNDIK